MEKNRISHVFQGDLVVDDDDDDDDGIDIDNISIVDEYSTSAWMESPINDIGVFSICIIGSYGIFYNRSNSVVRSSDVLYMVVIISFNSSSGPRNVTYRNQCKYFNCDSFSNV